MSRPGLVGAFVPQCTDDGSYEKVQCHGSSGHCWCVDGEGTELEGTRKAPGRGTVDCDAPGKDRMNFLFYFTLLR